MPQMVGNTSWFSGANLHIYAYMSKSFNTVCLQAITDSMIWGGTHCTDESHAVAEEKQACGV